MRQASAAKAKRVSHLSGDDTLVAAAKVTVDGSVAATEQGDTLASALAIDGKSEK